RVLRALLDGEATDFTWNGETHEVAHMHRGEGFFDFEHPIPLYVAANGPLPCKTAGAYGDGRVASAEGAGTVARSPARVEDGAREIGRVLPGSFAQAFLVSALVLRPGETLASDRVIESVGAEVTAILHNWWETWELTGRELAPEGCRDVWEQYKTYTKSL